MTTTPSLHLNFWIKEKIAVSVNGALNFSKYTSDHCVQNSKLDASEHVIELIQIWYVVLENKIISKSNVTQRRKSNYVRKQETERRDH